MGRIRTRLGIGSDDHGADDLEDLVGRHPDPFGVMRWARMAGSSISAPGAAPWVTDFLNAAYCARAGED